MRVTPHAAPSTTRGRSRCRRSAATVWLAVLGALLALAAPAIAQDCRTNFGGTYTYAHTGIKPDGHYFSSIASFNFHPDGTFDVGAEINERDVTPFPVQHTGSWWWTGTCDIAINTPGLLGRVSNDGRFISMATFNEEQMAGVAVRDTP